MVNVTFDVALVLMAPLFVAVAGKSEVTDAVVEQTELSLADVDC